MVSDGYMCYWVPERGFAAPGAWSVTKASRNLQAAEGDCKPVTVNRPALMGRRWRTGYDLIWNGLACKANIVGLQKATHTEVPTRKHPCDYHCPAGCASGALTIETHCLCIHRAGS